MSKYRAKPLDVSGLNTIPILARGGKVRVDHFARPYKKGESVIQLVGSLPRLLGADSFRSVVEAIFHAKSAGKPVIWGIGGHVIKCGLAPILIDLMERGFATAFAMNGA